MEKSFSLSFDVVILCSCEELTHRHFWTVTGTRAITHKKPKRAAFPASSNAPRAPLHSFLTCNHLSPLSPECTHRKGSGERPHCSQRENGAMRGQKLRGLFQIDSRLIEHRFVLPWGVSEICSAILYLEHLSPKDRQIPTDFYFPAAPKHNKLPPCLSVSDPPFWAALLFRVWSYCWGTQMSHHGNPSPEAAWSAMHSPQQAQHELGQSLPVWNWLLAGSSSPFPDSMQCHNVSSATQFSAVFEVLEHFP